MARKYAEDAFRARFLPAGGLPAAEKETWREARLVREYFIKRMRRNAGMYSVIFGAMTQTGELMGMLLEHAPSPHRTKAEDEAEFLKIVFSMLKTGIAIGRDVPAERSDTPPEATNDA